MTDDCAEQLILFYWQWFCYKEQTTSLLLNGCCDRRSSVTYIKYVNVTCVHYILNFAIVFLFRWVSLNMLKMNYDCTAYCSLNFEFHFNGTFPILIEYWIWNWRAVEKWSHNWNTIQSDDIFDFMTFSTLISIAIVITYIQSTQRFRIHSNFTYEKFIEI